MNNPAWRQSVMAYIRAEAQPKDKFGHQPRLYALATAIGKGMEFDDDVLFAAAWMHDLGVYIGHRPSSQTELERWNHVPYTIARTRELLAACGFPIQKLDGVVRSHPHPPAASTIQTPSKPSFCATPISSSSWAPSARCARWPRWAATRAIRRFPPCCRCCAGPRRTARQNSPARRPGSRRAPCRDSSPLIAAITSEAGDLLY